MTIRYLCRPLPLPQQARATAARAGDMFATAHAESADMDMLLCAELLRAVAEGRARDAVTAAQAWAVYQRARSA
jgi:alkanesulfonate monooxygenase SsuD/methylene tetrahydromethanopterin reductase-like flavin-dependent oxidoreductase (luciferase family)